MPIKKFRFKNLGAKAHYNTMQYDNFEKASTKPRYAPDGFNRADIVVAHRRGGRVIEHGLDDACELCADEKKFAVSDGAYTALAHN